MERLRRVLRGSAWPLIKQHVWRGHSCPRGFSARLPPSGRERPHHI